MRQDILRHRKELRQRYGDIRRIERCYPFDRVELDTHLVQSRTAQNGGTLIFRYFLFDSCNVVRHNPQIRISMFPAISNRRCLASSTTVPHGKIQIPG